MRYGKLYQTANVSKDLINKTLSYVDMNKLCLKYNIKGKDNLMVSKEGD